MSDDRLAKYLAFVLRHKPEELGLSLDEHGYVDVEVLLERLPQKGFRTSLSDLERIVAEDEKGRYALRDGRIRANQGHSVATSAVDLTPIVPPPLLYHGTTVERWARIQQSGGLQRMQRHHVHLSAEPAAAWQVGLRYRREKPVLLQVDAAGMTSADCRFYRSENGIWLTDSVPLRYLSVLDCPPGLP